MITKIAFPSRREVVGRRKVQLTVSRGEGSGVGRPQNFHGNSTALADECRQMRPIVGSRVCQSYIEHLRGVTKELIAATREGEPKTGAREPVWPQRQWGDRADRQGSEEAAEEAAEEGSEAARRHSQGCVVGRTTIIGHVQISRIIINTIIIAIIVQVGLVWVVFWERGNGGKRARQLRLPRSLHLT